MSRQLALTARLKESDVAALNAMCEDRAVTTTAIQAWAAEHGCKASRGAVHEYRTRRLTGMPAAPMAAQLKKWSDALKWASSLSAYDQRHLQFLVSNSKDGILQIALVAAVPHARLR